MTTDIRIIHAHDFIKATTDGQLDLERSKELLVEVATASASLADYEVLLDTRKTKSVMSITDLWYWRLNSATLARLFIERRPFFASSKTSTMQGSLRSVQQIEASASRHSLPSKRRSNG